MPTHDREHSPMHSSSFVFALFSFESFWNFSKESVFAAPDGKRQLQSRELKRAELPHYHQVETQSFA